MSFLSELVAEMSGVSALVDSRKLAGGMRPDHLQQRLASSMASKIAQLVTLDPNGARQLLDAAHSCNYGIGQAIVVAAIDAKLEQQLDDEPQAQVSKRQQLLTDCQHYVTSDFMTSMRSSRTRIDVKLQVAAEYLANVLGCTHPHEQTFKYWLTLVLLSHFDTWPTYHNVFAYLNQFKADLAACRKKPPFAAIAKYPKVPHELPDAVFNVIYADAPPIVVSIDRFKVTAQAHVPLRKNSKLLLNESRALKAGTLTDGASLDAPTRQLPTPLHRAPPVDDTPAWARSLLQMVASNQQNGAPDGEIPIIYGAGTPQGSPRCRSISNAPHASEAASPASTVGYASPGSDIAVRPSMAPRPSWQLNFRAPQVCRAAFV